jgi:hypothetical protein
MSLFVVRMEPLDRDAPFELGIVGEKDLAHSAAAERGVDAVPAGEQIRHLDRVMVWTIYSTIAQ